MPEARIRLLSPQTYFGLYEKGHGQFDHQRLVITTPDDIPLNFPYDWGSNLPFAYQTDEAIVGGLSGSINITMGNAYCSEKTKSLLEENNYNLDAKGKELSLWHQRTAHANMGWVQRLMENDKEDQGSSSPPLIKTRCRGTWKCEHPKCAACILAKQHKTSAGSQTVSNKQERENAIRRKAQKAGDQVSGDQFVCKSPGRLPNTFGKEPPSERYHGGTLWVDHFSQYIHIACQVSLRAGETLLGKHEFERFAEQFGIKIHSYHTDNHPFKAQIIKDDLEAQGQTMTFSGVGAHHQNGVSERAIKTITYWARAMMLHQLLHWPEAFDEAYWPFAMEQAVHIWNNLPREDSGLTPTELFTGIKQPENGAILRARVWGCPSWVLDPTLQDGKKFVVV